VFERRTPEGRVIGFMVMNFSKHDQETLTLPFSVGVYLRPKPRLGLSWV